MGNNRQHRQETLMKKKNILLIFADQFRTDCIHALGNEVIQTPALDALCRESVVFDRCLTPSPVCVPARYSMMTGQYPCRTGCSNNPHRGHYTGDGMYARLSAMGYYTCGIGKMHFPYETYALHGFDERHTQEELYRGCDDYYNYLLQKGYDRVYDIFGQRSEMYYIPQISQLPASDHPSAWVGDRSVEFIKSIRKTSPFSSCPPLSTRTRLSPPAPWNKLYRDFLAVRAQPALQLCRPLDLLQHHTEPPQGAVCRSRPAPAEPDYKPLLRLHILCGLSDRAHCRGAQGKRDL